jgi:hypothetical protein
MRAHPSITCQVQCLFQIQVDGPEKWSLLLSQDHVRVLFCLGFSFNVKSKTDFLPWLPTDRYNTWSKSSIAYCWWYEFQNIHEWTSTNIGFSQPISKIFSQRGIVHTPWSPSPRSYSLIPPPRYTYAYFRELHVPVYINSLDFEACFHRPCLDEKCQTMKDRLSFKLGRQHHSKNISFWFKKCFNKCYYYYFLLFCSTLQATWGWEAIVYLQCTRTMDLSKDGQKQ